MARIRPEASIELGPINGHVLRADKWATGWLIYCDAYPDLAENYNGAHDISGALDLFEERAQVAVPDKLKESA